MTNEDIFRLLLVVLFASNRQLSDDDAQIDYAALNNLILISLLTSCNTTSSATDSENTTF